jgi:hypothetical protein
MERGVENKRGESMATYKKNADEGNRFMGKVGHNAPTAEPEKETTKLQNRGARNRNKRSGEDY